MQRRERILDAARGLFSRQGIETSTVDDLVAEAGISRATFYRAFSGLEDVVAALYEAYEERVLGDLAAVLDGLDASSDGLDAVSDRLLRDMAARGPIVLAMFREELRPGSSSAPMQGRRVRGQVEIIRRWWEERTGQPADDDLILSLVLLMQSFGLIVAGQEVGPEVFERYGTAIRFVVKAVVRAYLEALQAGR